MTLFTRIAATALTGLSLFASLSAPAQATPTRQEYHDSHIELARAVAGSGVTFLVNPKVCDEIPALGFYSGSRRVLVVCQENHLSTTVEDQVEWTADDYDTLRHEAQHLIQDCMDGRLDGELVPVYRDPIGLAVGALGTDRMRRIHLGYTNRGADLATVILEYEAFSVAALDDPLEQVEDIKRFCGVGN